jgi:hypothetical protein
MPGFPPEDWVRVKATVKSRTEAQAHDFCPACGSNVNAFQVGETGTLVVQPTKKTATKRASKVTESGGDVDDEGNEE